MTDPTSLALIYGSTREGRFCDVVAAWAAAEIGRHDFTLHVVDPVTIDLPTRHGQTNEALRALEQRLCEADAFVAVTPEYNHGYPAALKFLIDSFKAPWRAKPVAFVSYGGISGGLRAVEQLRLVFAELHAVAILVDEFQDTTDLQVEILSLIAAAGRTHFLLVGDPYQSIFHFSGARPDLADEFAEAHRRTYRHAAFRKFSVEPTDHRPCQSPLSACPSYGGLGAGKKFHRGPFVAARRVRI
jgi:NAD(P)H-dependent FMN reductase